ncbi:MAG: ATP-dependent helicase HrpB [Pseudomonadota bacterium]
MARRPSPETDAAPEPVLPIEAALPALIEALSEGGAAVLQAPPGAGKTTRVPLAMMQAGLPRSGKIVMLEPRRLAARGAAQRMADMLGEPVGETVGYRMRGDTRVSARTRIEVVTEGVLTRMLQSDPELNGIGAVIFDEFHERSLNADLGLALTCEAREALRPDLCLLVMSATLDADPVAQMLGAPVITAEGRSYPVDIRYLDRPLDPKARFETALADLVMRALADTQGGVLVFLPGEGEIRRTQAILAAQVPDHVILQPLYGALPSEQQQQAIKPLGQGRKVVLATAIAETALTIQDIRIVVDGGRARRARFDPGRGMARLVTERVSKAEATQRSGRAGRVAPGVAYRLWTKGEDGGLTAFPPPEITTADLCDLALELVQWGARDPSDLALLTQPPMRGLSEARSLLQALGALDAQAAITEHGRAIAALPLHPRLGHMLLRAGRAAAPLAALLNARDPMRDAGTDLAQRLALLKRDPKARPILQEAKRLAKLAPPDPAEPLSIGAQAALAFPDRIGLRRPGDTPRWLLSGGTGATMAADDALAGARLVVAAELDGAGRDARIRLAAALTEAELRALFPDRIGWVDVCRWSKRERRVEARRQEQYGALVLDDRVWKDPPDAAYARALLDGVRDLGLPWSPRARRLAARIALVRSEAVDLPDCSEPALLDTLDAWLLDLLMGKRTLDQVDLEAAILARLDWPQRQMLERRAPPDFTTPLGRKIPIDYSDEAPQVTLRLQEVFGLRDHPQIAGRPLRMTLLSPGQKPVQTTMDLPGFWASSYADVRKDMRGRYPKHPWPEDPTEAAPTLRAKPKQARS